jgi:hypothetical protein
MQGSLFDRKFQAALFTVGSAGGIDPVIPHAARIASGQEPLSGRSDFVYKIELEVARHSQADFGVGFTTPDSARQLEGTVSASANSALWLAAVAARSITQDSEAKTIPLPITTEASGKALMLILANATNAANPNEALKAVVQDPAFQSVVSLNFNASISQLIPGLPPIAQEFVGQIKDMTSPAQRAEVESHFSDQFGKAMAGAQTTYSELKSRLDEGASIATLRREGLIASAENDVQSVAAIGAFVIGEVFGDKETAKKINAGAQLASVALQVGLMFSTGGLSAIACAGGIASSLGPLFGGEQSNSAAVQGMLSQISGQIETLRQEMHERFDRVEHLEQEALGMLRQIAEDIRTGNTAILDNIGNLRSELSQLNTYIKDSDRAKIFAAFNDLRFQAELAQEQHNISAASVAMGLLLNYALDVPKQTTFSNAEFTGPVLSGALKDSPRTDFCVGLLPRCANLLKVTSTGATPPNPVEWARGTNAYLETQVHFPELRDVVAVQTLARKARQTGTDIRKYFRANMTAEQLKTAVGEYMRCASQVADKVAELIQSKAPDDPRGPRIGPYFFPSGFSEDELTVERATVETGVKYVTGGLTTNTNYADLKILNVSHAEPLQWALETKRLRLEHVNTIDLTWHSFPAGGVGGSVGKLLRYRVTKKDGTAVRNIEQLRYDWPVSWHGAQVPFRPILPKVGKFDAWMVGNKDDIAEFWREIAPELEETSAIKAWLGDAVADPFKTIRTDTNYDEIAAALITWTSVFTWGVTDQLDDPGNGTMAAMIPRSIAEIRQFLETLAEGVFQRDKKLLPNVMPQVDGDARWDLNRLLAERSSNVSLGSASVKWSELNPQRQVEFRELATEMIRNWIGQAWEQADAISRHVDPNAGIPLVDRTLAKMDGLRTLSG